MGDARLRMTRSSLEHLRKEIPPWDTPAAEWKAAGEGEARDGNPWPILVLDRGSPGNGERGPDLRDG